MTEEHNPRATFREALLSQETSVSPDRYARYRQELDRKIRKAAGREKRMRWITLLVWAVAFAAVPALMVLDRLPLSDATRDVARVVLGTAAGCAVPFLLLYLLRYRLALDRAEHEARDAALAEVGQKLDGLGRRLPPPPE